MVLQEEILCYVGVSNINTVNIKDQTYDEIDESLRETAWCVFGLRLLGLSCPLLTCFFPARLRPYSRRGCQNASPTKMSRRAKSPESAFV